MQPLPNPPRSSAIDHPRARPNWCLSRSPSPRSLLLWVLIFSHHRQAGTGDNKVGRGHPKAGTATLAHFASSMVPHGLFRASPVTATKCRTHRYSITTAGAVATAGLATSSAVELSQPPKSKPSRRRKSMLPSVAVSIEHHDVPTPTVEASSAQATNLVLSPEKAHPPGDLSATPSSSTNKSSKKRRHSSIADAGFARPTFSGALHHQTHHCAA